MEENEMLIGVKQICEFCGGIGTRTLRRWVDKRGFPVNRKGGCWVASKTKIIEWSEKNGK